MSRPRPPLHDPYGLLRPPPPEDPISLYSTSNALTSTTSLPLSTNSPNRRARQRGASPSRTQHGEEYEDQPYLTNVLFVLQGQVTLVPPVNQGRTRKARRKRGPEAATSTVSLADTLAGPSSSSDPSRVSAGPQPRSRRPRQGSETRAASSPDVRDSSYPDYPPPSFEEVLALDRNNAPSTPPTDEPARAHDVSSPMFLVSAPPSLSQNSTATPWEHDRLLGLSLEERVRREYERKLKRPSGSESATAADRATPLPRPSSPVPVSPTATSVTASFLTPQNLTPPSGAALLLSTASSPKATESHQSAGPPLVPPKLADTPTVRTNETLPDHDAGLVVRNAPVEPQPPVSTELDELGIGDSNQSIRPKPTRLDQPSPQGASHDSGVPLTSLLFTTRLRLDSSPEHSPVREPGREISPVRGSQPEAEAKVSQAATRETAENSPRRNAFPRVHPEQIVPLWETTSGPSRATSPIRNSSPSRPVDTVRSPSPKAPPTLLNTPVPAVPARAIAESSPSSSTAPRRPPPPPPPRPRQRPAGSGVAARISAYESLLANAPKVPPPIPPRPRPRSQTALDNPPEAQAARDVSGASTGAAVSNSVQQTAADHMIEEPNEPGGAEQLFRV
ncbi:unnamed protein product [Rhizoctonia solani]|uniref:Uncharacterized protein n=1 Tax=Rhizoctonia solani TaxID=456999 RepID=A0A8H3DWP8_9AGAM|nr:unnamed protein product [Rhizoctonia solani]